MAALRRARRLERDDSNALGVEAAQGVPDGPILAARVHALEDDQDGPPGFGVKPVLELHDVLLIGERALTRPVPLDAVRLGRIDGSEVEPAMLRASSQGFSDGLAIGRVLAAGH
jgi:hypothetical protein